MTLEVVGAGVVLTGGGGASAVAGEVRGVAIAGDTAGEEGVRRLITEAQAVLARSTFSAPTPVSCGTGPDAAEADWALSWEVTVMAHVGRLGAAAGRRARRRGHFDLSAGRAHQDAHRHRQGR
ncbi:hypothetical protein ABZ863_10905 [Saccharomonospora sp. NPDC046836]|uniref:hypothetical protein n=1 Tax=Saccharomonospora sp. NPDC046836 TaxID=3156921 RepID=UPI003406A1AC